MNHNFNIQYSSNILNSIKGDLYDDPQFEPTKHFYENFEKISFRYNEKEDRLNLTKEIIKRNKQNYDQTSDQIVDKLMDNYHVFVNLGKYINKIDESIGKLMNYEKNYSSKLQSLRSNIEEFSITFQQEKEKSKAEKTKNEQNEIYFESFDDDKNILELELDIKDFLNPKEGSKRWLQETASKITVFADEKNFKEGVNVIVKCRKIDISMISYSEKIELDLSYNYFLEKLTLSISKSLDVNALKENLDLLVMLDCESLAVNSLLDWIAKKLKQKINQFDDGEDEEFKKMSIDNKIIIVMETFYNKLDYYLDLMKEYLHIDEKIDKKGLSKVETFTKYSKFDNFNIFSLLWFKEQHKNLNQQLELYYGELSNINQFRNLIKIYSKQMIKENEFGKSSLYLISEYIIKNFKLGLESICANIVKEKGSEYELKSYLITIKNINYEFTSCSELGFLLQNILLLIIEFNLLKNEYNSSFLLTLEEYFFKHLLTNDLLYVLRGKVNQISNILNSEVKTFSDCTGSLPGPNHILLMYSISLNSFIFALENIRKENKIILKTDEFYECLITVNRKFSENLFRQKLEWHFFKAFSSDEKFKENISITFSRPDICFTIFFSLLKSLTNNLKIKACSDDIIYSVIINSQIRIFLNLLIKLKDIDILYESSIKFIDMGINTLENVIYGIFFIEQSLSLILNFKVGNIYDNIGNYIPLNEEFKQVRLQFIQIFCDYKKLKPERFISKLDSMEEQTKDYIAKNKFELSK